MKLSYAEQLRDPRWQKKRLEVMERDGFACRRCRDNTKTLNVHHAYYERGKLPWEYPSESLQTLCERCHDRFEKIKTDMLKCMNMLSFMSLSLLMQKAADLLNAERPTVIETPIIDRQITNRKPAAQALFDQLEATKDFEKQMEILLKIQNNCNEK